MRWRAVFIVGCFVGLWWGIVWPQESGSLSGVVRKDGQPVAAHRIMLLRFGPNQDVQRTPGQTDAEGRFAFQQLETGPQFSYVVGIRHAEQLYRSAPVVLASGQVQDDVLVEVGATGTLATDEGQSASPMVIEHHIMAVVWRQNYLDVREVITVNNTGSVPYEGTKLPNGQMSYSLRLPLPEEYYHFQPLEGLTPQSLQSLASGVYYTAPLLPGAHRVVYSYALPMSSTVRTVLARRTLPTRVFDIFVDTRQLVASSDIPFYGQVVLESHPFFHFRGTNLEANARAWLQLTRVTASAFLLRMLGYGGIIGIALLGVAVPVSSVWRRRARQQRVHMVSVEQLQQWHTERVGLVQTIARLDDQHAAGVLDEVTYQQSRRACKRQLLDIVERLYALQQSKDGLPSAVGGDEDAG